MDTIVFITLLLFFVFQHDSKSNAVPLNVLSDLSANSIDDTSAEDGSIDEDEDFTTHGFERLSSAATCLVAGVEYTHGQQIYRKDPCEFCLCLDGEMFCWWQDCPPTMEGPCRDRGPFTPCLNIPSSSIKTPINEQTSTFEPELAENLTDSSTLIPEGNSTEELPSTTLEHRFCLVMGRKYEIGDKLPHDTGNCVECICAQGGKITCSPHQCAPAGEEINDYRPPGPRQTDVF